MIRRPDTQETKQFRVVSDGVDVQFDDAIDLITYFWKQVNDPFSPVQTWTISKKLYMSHPDKEKKRDETGDS